MSVDRLGFGDRVRHPGRPEWGIGSVVKAEDLPVNGEAVQRVSVRFPNAGLKVLNTSQAPLERIAGQTDLNDVDSSHGSVAAWKRVEKSEWLAPVAEKKIEEAIISVPMEARDPFSSLRDRLAFSLNLYRFSRNGGPLLDWAVAQSGLDDPLSHFSRQELETLFDRWADERDEHVAKLMREADDRIINELLAQAPRGALDAVQRLRAKR